MNDLEIRSEFKHDVYSFAEHISGPLVQRVNKQVNSSYLDDFTSLMIKTTFYSFYLKEFLFSIMYF